jgi:hypothetical protein
MVGPAFKSLAIDNEVRKNIHIYLHTKYVEPLTEMSVLT